MILIYRSADGAIFGAQERHPGNVPQFIRGETKM